MEERLTTCIECGGLNYADRDFCTACGAPVWNPNEPAMASDLPDEAWQLWEQATAEWKDALKEGEPDTTLWGHIASLLSLAVSYAGSAPFPRAHSHLAIALLTLGMDEEADREATIALEQDGDEFRAQQVKVALALSGRTGDRADDSVNDVSRLPRKPDLGDDPFLEELGVDDPWDSSSGTDSPRDEPRPDLVPEIERMLAIFRRIVETQSSVDEYLNVADFMVLLGDTLEQRVLDELRAEMYGAVAQAPLDNVDYAGREHEVAELMRRAQRGLVSCGVVLEP
jgi:hypothetical protein